MNRMCSSGVHTSRGFLDAREFETPAGSSSSGRSRVAPRGDEGVSRSRRSVVFVTAASPFASPSSVPSPFASLSSAPSLFASPRAAGVSFASGGESPSPRVFASSRSPSSRPSSAVVAVGETPSRARSSFSVVFADWLFGMGVSSATAKGKRRGRVDDDWSASVVKLKRVFFFFARGKTTRAEEETDCHRVASGTHHALVIARLPRGIGHPRARAGLVYVRERLEAGPRASSRLPRARTRPARRSRAVPQPPGNHALARVGTRKTNARNRRRARSRRARRAADERACRTVRS
jgi:hypothetical protein